MVIVFISCGALGNLDVLPEYAKSDKSDGYGLARLQGKCGCLCLRTDNDDRVFARQVDFDDHAFKGTDEADLVDHPVAQSAIVLSKILGASEKDVLWAAHHLCL